MTYGLFGGFTAAPGKRDELALCEVWADEAAHDASLNNVGVPELIAEAREVIAGVIGHTSLQVLGGKGLPS